MTNKSNVLLLGGTGPIGIHLQRILSDRGVIVYVTSRKERSDYNNVKFVQGNAKDEKFINNFLRDKSWDCIVDFMVYNTDEFKDRIEPFLINTKQYVFLSSSRVYDNTDKKITEATTRLLDTCNDSKYTNTDEYALYKAREEDLLRQSGYNNYTIIRPYITYAENRLPLGVLEKESWMQRVLQGKDIVIPADVLEKNTTLTYGEDVSLVISSLINNQKALGEVINIVQDKALQWKRALEIYLNAIEKHAGRRPKVYTFGRASYSWKAMIKRLLIDALYLGQCKFKRSDFSLNYQLEYDRMYDRVFDNSKTKSFLNIEFKPVEKTLEECTEHFMIHPTYSYIDWQQEFVHDRISGNKTQISLIPSWKLRLIYILIRYIIPLKYITIE